MAGRVHAQGVARYGAPVDHGACINRAIVCLTCGRRGVESTAAKV